MYVKNELLFSFCSSYIFFYCLLTIIVWNELLQKLGKVNIQRASHREKVWKKKNLINAGTYFFVFSTYVPQPKYVPQLYCSEFRVQSSGFWKIDLTFEPLRKITLKKNCIFLNYSCCTFCTIIVVLFIIFSSFLMISISLL